MTLLLLTGCELQKTLAYYKNISSQNYFSIFPV